MDQQGCKPPKKGPEATVQVKEIQQKEMEKDQKPWKGKNEETRGSGAQVRESRRAPVQPCARAAFLSHVMGDRSSLPASQLQPHWHFEASWQCFPSPSLKGKAELQGQRAGRGKVSSSRESNKNWSNLNWVTCQVCLLQMHSLSLYDRCPHSQSVSAELISPEIQPL